MEVVSNLDYFTVDWYGGSGGWGFVTRFVLNGKSAVPSPFDGVYHLLPKCWDFLNGLGCGPGDNNYSIRLCLSGKRSCPE
ncbi:MAG: hypothetical protein JSR71_14340 [Proteobacteria bacterium]|nr:hypothetical protein [Pseudomonadota bacterium]